MNSLLEGGGFELPVPRFLVHDALENDSPHGAPRLAPTNPAVRPQRGLARRTLAGECHHIAGLGHGPLGGDLSSVAELSSSSRLMAMILFEK